MQETNTVNVSDMKKVSMNSQFGKQQQHHLVFFFFSFIILPHDSIEEKEEEIFQIYNSFIHPSIFNVQIPYDVAKPEGGGSRGLGGDFAKAVGGFFK